MISLNLCFFLEYDSLEIELKIFFIFILLKITNYFIRLDEIDINLTEETHTNFWSFL